MKQGLVYILIMSALVTGLFMYTERSHTTTPALSGHVMTNAFVVKNHDITLNAFVGLYASGVFDTIQIVDATKLIGYQSTGAKPTRDLMTLGAPINKSGYITYSTNKPLDTSLGELGISATGTTRIEAVFNTPSVFGEITTQVVGFLIILLVLGAVMRFMGGKGLGLPFSLSVGRLKKSTDPKTTFSDVAGMEECKAELKEIVDYLKDPEKYIKVGARPPKGVLLHGAPGGGKTLLARAVAGEANVPFYSASGSEFIEMIVGVGAAKVRDLFRKAKASAPSIIFIDEIDAIGKKRGTGNGGSHQEQEQTLNQILTEMDGFEQDTKVIVIAATNRPDVLDSALLRAGRFDRKVFVGRPTLEEREHIIKYYLKDKKVADTVKLDVFARRTTGMVGADIENIINEASLKLARENREVLTTDDFEFALEKVVMGPEKKIKSLRDQERNIITYHELGHAITAHLLPEADPVEKISIVSRGMALGVTWMMPEEDKYLYSKAKFLDEVVSLLGGRAAEEIMFGKEHITTGASNDLERVTRIVTDMIVKYGMDEEIGLGQYKTGEESYEFYRPYSEQTADKIDGKIKLIIAQCYDKAKQILSDNKELMQTLAKVLLQKEYLTKEEFELLMSDPSQAQQMMDTYSEQQAEAAHIVPADDIQVVELQEPHHTPSSHKKKTS